MCRFNDAKAIQDGASNISGMAHALVRACNDCRAEGVDYEDDSAVRLIVHQIAWVARTRDFDNNLAAYSDALDACKKEAEARRAAANAQ